MLAGVAYRLASRGLLRAEGKQLAIAEKLRENVYRTLNKTSGW